MLCLNSSFYAAVGNSLSTESLGSAGTHLMGVPSLDVIDLCCLSSVPAESSLIYFVQFIVAYNGRASYFVLAGN